MFRQGKSSRIIYTSFLFLNVFLFSNSSTNAAAGDFDLTFNGFGFNHSITNLDNKENFAIALQNEGKIVVAQHTQIVANYDLAVIRFNENGTLDTTFGGDGIYN
jgi:Domain of unknown function (DUF5122) beta-propeller